MTAMTFTTALPDPDAQPEFYASVPAKRLLAWCMDVVFVIAMTAPLTLLIALPGLVVWPLLLLIPLLWIAGGFAYRWATLSNASATWGMRLMAIELRDIDGDRLSGTTAFWHTAGYALCIATAPLQLISIAMMAFTPRGQGIGDTLLGTTAINRAI